MNHSKTPPWIDQAALKQAVAALQKRQPGLTADQVTDTLRSKLDLHPYRLSNLERQVVWAYWPGIGRKPCSRCGGVGGWPEEEMLSRPIIQVCKLCGGRGYLQSGWKSHAAFTLGLGWPLRVWDYAVLLPLIASISSVDLPQDGWQTEIFLLRTIGGFTGALLMRRMAEWLVSR